MDMVDYLEKFIGTKYSWAGNTAEEGFDCSGLLCEGLRAIGKLGKEDLSAQQLHNRLYYNAVKTAIIQKNVMLFFGKNASNITHVAVAMNNLQMIEAGGEGRDSTTKGAVRVRYLDTRKDLVAAYSIVPAGVIYSN